MTLAAFDQYEIAVQISDFPLPLLVGIGHEVDETVLDHVASRSLKTPTAVADFLIQHQLQFESALEQLAQHISWQSGSILQEQQIQLERLEDRLAYSFKTALHTQDNLLNSIEKQLHLLDPQRILARGYALATKEGRILRDTSDLKAGDIIEVKLQKGVVISEVKKTDNDGNEKDT